MHDAENQLIETERPDTTEVKTAYHDDRQVHTQTDGAGSVTTYLYDDLGRLASITDPLSNITAFGYDPVGNLTATQQPGGDCFATPTTGCVTNSYDAANQLQTVTYSDGTTPNITDVHYDDNGRRTQVDYGTSDTSTWSYDSLGPLTSSSDGTTVDYGYDLAGNLTTIDYPGDNTVTRVYDDAGRLTSSTDWNSNTTDFGYDEDSNLTTIDDPTGDQTDAFGYDRADRIDTIDMVAGSTTLAELDYTRDDNGQITAEDLTSLPGADHSWDYDTLERLTTQDTATTWGYDNADNPTTLGSTEQVFNTANQLCSTAPTTGTCTTPAPGATSHTYDNRSNLTTITPPAPATPTTLTYDQANRLTAHSTANATYTYNPDGLRTSKTVNTTTTEFTWDKTGGLPMLLTETQGTSGTHYLYGPGNLPYAQIDPTGTITYLHHDQLGSTRLLTNTTGTTTGTATYTPYGTPEATTGTLTPFGYAGQYTDEETGYQYLRARYYSPTTAQFITKDPITPLTREPHNYVTANPLNNTDPTGLFGFSAITGAIGGVVGAATGAVSHVADNGFSDARGFGAAVFGGAVGGAITGVCIGMTGGAAVHSGACGTAGSVVGGLVEGLVGGEGYSLRQAGLDATVGFAAGALGGIAANRVGFEINPGRIKPTKMVNVVRPRSYARHIYAHTTASSGLFIGGVSVARWLGC
ncbi:MAG: RHS repeat-associated core domain-containing protein [Microthrixaceae bacterium]